MKKLLALICMATLLLSCAALADEDTVSYYAYWCGNVKPDDYVVKFVEDMTGIDVDVVNVSHQDNDAVQLMLGTGEMPDCGFFDKGYKYMSENELIRTIPVEMVQEYCPGYMELCNQYPILKALSLDPEDETQFRFFCDCNESEYPRYVYCYFIRYDWVQKLGIDLGDVEIKQLDDQLFIADRGLSRDVFTDLMRHFVNDDPDGNGENDTFGLICDWDKLPMLSSAGLINGNMELDGHVTEWYTHPALKEHLNYLKSIYDEGLLYPEFMTIGWGADWEIINNYKCGVHGKTSDCCLNSWASNRPPRTLLDNADSEVKLLMIPGVADETGRTYRTRMISPAAGDYFYVNADVSDEKLVSILKLVQATCFSTDLNARAVMWYGEENVNWTWQNDRPVVTDTPAINGERGTQIFVRNYQTGELVDWIAFEDQFRLGMDYYWEPYNGVWCPDLIYPYKYDINNETKTADISAEYSASWINVRDGYFLDVILGNKNTEEDWDSYIAAMNDAHYGEYLEELDKAPVTKDLNRKLPLIPVHATSGRMSIPMRHSPSTL